MKVDKFNFKGVPESVQVEELGDGFKIKIFCKNIYFNISNIEGITNATINYYTSSKEKTYLENKQIKVTGVIGKETDHKRELVALRLEALCE